MYSFNTFDVTEFMNSKYKSTNPSTLGRLINSLVYGLNKHRRLPKLITVITDDDIVRTIKTGAQMKSEVTMVVSWIMKEFSRAISAYKDFLPIKCQRNNTPHVLWMCPPSHKNFGNSSNARREMLTQCLEDEVRNHRHMSTLRIIKSWSHDDPNLFVYDTYRFTA